MDIILIAGIAAYVIASLFVSFEADMRNHSFGYAFMLCIFTTPVIGAILFTTYKQKIDYDKKPE